MSLIRCPLYTILHECILMTRDRYKILCGDVCKLYQGKTTNPWGSYPWTSPLLGYSFSFALASTYDSLYLHFPIISILLFSRVQLGGNLLKLFLACANVMCILSMLNRSHIRFTLEQERHINEGSLHPEIIILMFLDFKIASITA